MGFPLTVWLILIAVAGVPPGATRWDVADCNVKARDSVPAAHPPMSIAVAAPRDLLRSVPPPVGPRAAPGDTTMSPGETDTEIQGLAGDRASDEAYVVAYRLCMRQRGF